MTDTLLFLATAGGSGYAASLLMTAFRELFPRPTQAHWSRAAAWQRWLWSALYAPRYARITVFALALLVASLASGIVSFVVDRDASLALEAALAVVISQLAQPQSRRVELEGTE